MLSNGRVQIVIVAGPTCTGKSDLAMDLAREFDGEIVNADAMQVYRRFDIGTAKPTEEMRREIPHHLVDMVEPDEEFNASIFSRKADEAIGDVAGRGRLPIIVGGTGLYVRALLYGLSEAATDHKVRGELQRRFAEAPLDLYEELKRADPEYARRISHRDRVRVVRALEVLAVTGRTMTHWESLHGFREKRYDSLGIALQKEREELYRLVNDRVDRMLAMGWVQEVRNLLDAGFDSNLKPFSGIGYREIVLYIHGGIGYEDMVHKIKTQTRHYAKRQFTWFLRDGDLAWYEYPQDAKRVRGRVADFYHG